MKCKLCGNELEELSCNNISMTEDKVEYACAECGRIFEYKIPTRGW